VVLCAWEDGCLPRGLVAKTSPGKNREVKTPNEKAPARVRDDWDEYFCFKRLYEATRGVLNRLSFCFWCLDDVSITHSSKNVTLTAFYVNPFGI
jgi:hypothetical protein